MASCNYFLSKPTTYTTFLDTFKNSPPRFCCKNVALKIAHLLKKNEINKPSLRTLAYFVVDNEIKLFLPTLFFFINKSKKLHHLHNQSIHIYICNSFLIHSIFLSLFYVFFLSNQVV